MVEHDVGNSAHTLVAGNCNHGQRNLVNQIGVDRNQTLRAPADQHAGVLLDQVRPVAVVGYEVEILFLEKPVSNASHHFRVIAVGEDRNQNADGHGAAISQGSGEETGLIVEFERCLADSLPRSFRNGASWNLVQNDRYGRRIEIEISRKGLETDGASRLAIVAGPLSHRADDNLIGARAGLAIKYQPRDF